MRRTLTFILCYIIVIEKCQSHFIYFLINWDLILIVSDFYLPIKEDVLEDGKLNINREYSKANIKDVLI